MIALHKIPYVTNLPDDGQTKIIWIKNGELLEGASTNHGHDGVLNATGVQIQENVEVLEVNIKNVANSLNETNATVEKLEELIAIAGNLDLVEQVKTNTDDIKLVKTEQKSLNETVETTSEEVNQVIQEIGARSISSGTRTVFDDLVFIKSVVGQEPGQDINGNMSPGAEASGIIRKLGDTTKQVIINTDNIATLSESVESADLPKLVEDTVSFRKELGSVQPNTLPMYTRLNTLETDSEKSKEEIEKISNSIGIDSRNIVEELDTLSANTDTLEKDLNTPTTGVKARLGNIETVVLDPTSGLNVKVDTIEDEIETINGKIGSSGISKDISDISNFVGYGAEPAPNTSLAGKLETLTALQNDTAASVQDIQVELGNANSGIKGDIKAINAKIAAQDARLDSFDERIKALEAKVAKLETVESV